MYSTSKGTIYTYLKTNETLKYKTMDYLVEYLHTFYYYFVHLSLLLTLKSLKFCSTYQVH